MFQLSLWILVCSVYILECSRLLSIAMAEVTLIFLVTLASLYPERYDLVSQTFDWIQASTVHWVYEMFLYYSSSFGKGKLQYSPPPWKQSHRTVFWSYSVKTPLFSVSSLYRKNCRLYCTIRIHFRFQKFDHRNLAIMTHHRNKIFCSPKGSLLKWSHRICETAIYWPLILCTGLKYERMLRDSSPRAQLLHDFSALLSFFKSWPCTKGTDSRSFSLEMWPNISCQSTVLIPLVFPKRFAGEQYWYCHSIQFIIYFIADRIHVTRQFVHHF